MHSRKQLQMKVISAFKTLKQRVIESQDDCPQEVKKAVQGVIGKMSQCKLAELHPPFMPKSITKFRHEYFLPLKKQYHPKLTEHTSNPDFQSALHFLHSFITRLDCQSFDLYLQQIREPYIRKMFNENYEFDKIDFKEINNEYKIRSETENLLNSASEWLIQIEKTQDLLERIELYFDIKTPMVIEKAKKEGIDLGSKRTWGESFFSAIRNVSSYTLRKSSKIIQSSFFTTIAPAAAMLTLAIIGGSATLPFQPTNQSKFLVAPIIAITVPYFLDGLASTIERKQYMQMLQEWAITLQQVGASIAKFNEEIQETILLCSTAQDYSQFAKHRLNLEKYVKSLNTSILVLADFDQSNFEEMRERTEAYFKNYIQKAEGEWTVVIPAEDMLHN